MLGPMLRRLPLLFSGPYGCRVFIDLSQGMLSTSR